MKQSVTEIVKTIQCNCMRCNSVWIPRDNVKLSKVCPYCKSSGWQWPARISRIKPARKLNIGRRRYETKNNI